VQARHDIKTALRRFAEQWHPICWNTTTDRRRADDHTLGTGINGSSEIKVSDTHIDCATRQPYLTEAVAGAPLRQTESGLGEHGALNIAKEDDEGRAK
jgi:hypothetical protein